MTASQAVQRAVLLVVITALAIAFFDGVGGAIKDRMEQITTRLEATEGEAK